MRSTQAAVIAFIALVACRDGPTAPPPAATPASSAVARHAGVANLRISQLGEELRGPFVQALVRSRLDPKLADDLRSVLPSRMRAANDDQLSEAESSVKQLAARVGQSVAVAQEHASLADQVDDADAAIVRDVLQLILDDATQALAFERARLHATRAMRIDSNHPHD